MKLVIFGLTVSSSWGNGHATLWRGLLKGLARLGHEVVFYERDVPYYANHRDLHEIPGGTLRLYQDWSAVLPQARRDLAGAEVGMVTSYCADGPAACDLVLGSPVPFKSFYDLDTPVTLANLQSGGRVEYLPDYGLGDFDLVLSYTGGAALEELRSRLGARRVAPLYGHVDPEVHRPVDPVDHYRCSLSYIGTYARDRQQSLERLFVDPARRLPEHWFVLAGSQYPQEFPWTQNIAFVRHLPPSEHAAFYSSSRLTLNITRRAMAAMGYCPSGRLFEASAAGVPVLSDSWAGLSDFFEPGREILVASTTEEATAALELSDAELAEIGRAARARTLEEHTSAHRARELQDLLQRARVS